MPKKVEVYRGDDGKLYESYEDAIAPSLRKYLIKLDYNHAKEVAGIITDSYITERMVRLMLKDWDNICKYVEELKNER